MLKIIMPIHSNDTLQDFRGGERRSERAQFLSEEGGRTARSISAFSFRNLILSQLRLELSVDKKNTREMLVPAAKKVDLIAQRT